jgi:predicted alpha/beta hydrolase family esterase
LPNADTPLLAEWLDLLVAEGAQMGDGERVVIAHSMGCVLWYEASARGVLASAADRVLLVSPPGPSFIRGRVVASFFSGAWTADSLGASSRSRIRVVASDADPYCVEGPAAAVYGEPLGLDAETMPSAGHITISDGYGPWPDVLRWSLDPSARFTGGDATDR